MIQRNQMMKMNKEIITRKMKKKKKMNLFSMINKLLKIYKTTCNSKMKNIKE